MEVAVLPNVLKQTPKLSLCKHDQIWCGSIVHLTPLRCRLAAVDHSHSVSWQAAWFSGLSEGLQSLDGWPLELTHSTFRSITPAPQVCEHCRKHTHTHAQI